MNLHRKALGLDSAMASANEPHYMGDLEHKFKELEKTLEKKSKELLKTCNKEELKNEFPLS